MSSFCCTPINATIVGCGFLGKAAAQLFSEKGAHVLGIVHSNDSREKIISSQHSKSPPFDIAVCDVCNQKAVDCLTDKVPKNSVMIYAVSSNRGGADAYTAIYRDALKRVLDSWQPTKIIFVSSTSVYAQTSGEEVSELSPTQPERETSRILLEAEKIALDAGGIVVRLSGIYGPGRSVLIKKFLSGQAILEERNFPEIASTDTVQPAHTGSRWLNQIHRDDAAKALLHLALLKNASGIYNVTDNTPATQHDVYKWIANYFHKPMPPSGPADLTRKRAWTSKKVSNAKIRSLGWHPNFPSYREALPFLDPLQEHRVINPNISH